MGVSSRLPAPGPLARGDSIRRSARDSDKAPQLPFADIDLLSGKTPALAVEQPADSLLAARLQAVARLRPERATASGTIREASMKDAPWTTDHLLADATNMDDNYVSMQYSPFSGYLYAVFCAYDLGGSDRDIHIARSRDDGATWQVWEMPSSSLDEYQPELAVDAAGYLFVTWIRDDGYIARARSEAAEDPQNWAFVRGLAVGEPCATPSIAVSGAGQFANVVIAASWLTVNYDMMQYEWTLIWMYSTTGGETVVYDYFLPDGYGDTWPDVEMNGSTVYMINGEQDPYTGEVEILLAADNLAGGFVDPFYLTDWTSMTCGFPSLAADGDRVYCAYQLDFVDGPAVDGDIIYCFSWDAAQTLYGPYELAATTDESVGPAIYCRDGVVGCAWLEAPAGGDEFSLRGRQASLDGHPDYWLDAETISDFNLVEPTFRSAAGAVASERLHAAWIDRRDYPTQGLNVYTSERAMLPNLAPFTPETWAAPLVVSMTEGDRSGGILGAGEDLFVSLALANNGLAEVTEDFQLELSVDGAPVATWLLSGGLPRGSYSVVEDHVLVLDAGPHDLAFDLDGLDAVIESDESDNTYTTTVQVIAGEPLLRLEPGVVDFFVEAPVAARPTGDPAASPPLKHEISLPVIEPRLSDALESSPDKMLHVMIVPAARVDGAEMQRRLSGVKNADRRSVVAEVLKSHATTVRAELDPLLNDLSAGGHVGRTTDLWLAGMLGVYADAEAVAVLSASPHVGRLWLDDRLSGTFGVPAADSKALAWHLPWIGADALWAAGLDGDGILVGLTDTGVCHDHPDLVGQLWDGGAAYPHHGYDFLDEDDDPWDGDSYYHGTHTAGLIVGDGTSGTATGVAPAATLMALRCVPGYLEDLVQSLQMCLDEGVDMISTSAGWSQAVDDVRGANRYNAEILLAAGVHWICAAGNGDNYGGHYPVPTDIASPGDCPHPTYGNGGHSSVITIGAVDETGAIWSSSSYGPTEWQTTGEYVYDDYPMPAGLIKPDLALPGVNITSTYASSGYVVYSGTSMATPIAAGALALLLQAAPDLLQTDIAKTLDDAAVDLGPAGRDEYYGAGRLDLPIALARFPEPSSAMVWICNDGALPLEITSVTENVPWLVAAPGVLSVAPSDSARLTLTFGAAGLPAGLYETLVRIEANTTGSPHSLPVRMAIGDVSGIESGPVTARVNALSSHPNPFNPQTVIRFDNGFDGRVRLDIIDTRGRLVAHLVDGWTQAGRHEVTWFGRDRNGRSVGSGVYLVRLVDASGRCRTHKVALVR